MSNRRTVPQPLLEAYVLSELSVEERARVERALEDDPEVRAQLAALRASSEEVLREYPARVIAAELRRRLERGRRRTPRLRSLALRLAAACATTATLALTVGLLEVGRGPRTEAGREAAALESTRPKGLAPTLLVYRRLGATTERLKSASALTPGDLVQLRYIAAGRAHGVLLSIDGRGEISVHLPASGGLSARLEPDGERALATAFELDDAPGFERFFLITGPRPFSTAPVLSAANALIAAGDAERGALALPPELEQTSTLLLKGL